MYITSPVFFICQQLTFAYTSQQLSVFCNSQFFSVIVYLSSTPLIVYLSSTPVTVYLSSAEYFYGARGRINHLVFILQHHGVLVSQARYFCHVSLIKSLFHVLKMHTSIFIFAFNINWIIFLMTEAIIPILSKPTHQPFRIPLHLF